MAEDTQVQQSISRKFRVLLIVSLALNLLVVGVLIGGAVMGRPPASLGGPAVSLGPFSQALPPGHRASLRRDYRKRLDAHGMTPPNRSAALAEFLEVLRTEPFDPEKVEAMFDAQRDQSMRGMQTAQDVFLEQLVEMEPSQRAAFADRLEKGLKSRRMIGRSGN